MLITFEGVEGSGKTTQIDLLCDYLRDRGFEVLKTREPGGTAMGEALRAVTLQKGLRITPLAEVLLFMAVRAQHVEDVIMPALQQGKVVLCDRFVDATYAYQGYGRGFDLGIIETLNRLVTKGVRPNLTIVLNIPVNVGFRRKKMMASSKDRFEEEERAFHKRIQQAYLKLAEEDDKRFFIVDGRGSVDEIAAVSGIGPKIAAALHEFLKRE